MDGEGDQPEYMKWTDERFLRARFPAQVTSSKTNGEINADEAVSWFRESNAMTGCGTQMVESMLKEIFAVDGIDTNILTRDVDSFLRFLDSVANHYSITRGQIMKQLIT